MQDRQLSGTMKSLGPKTLTCITKAETLKAVMLIQFKNTGQCEVITKWNIWVGWWSQQSHNKHDKSLYYGCRDLMAGKKR